MKRLLIILGLSVMVLLSSMVYRERNRSPWIDFPVVKQQLPANAADKMKVYFFFSIRDCATCLEIIDNLNRLRDEFVIVGIMKDQEISDIDFIRREYGVQFEIMNSRRFNKYKPVSSPSLLGVDKKGRIMGWTPVFGQGTGRHKVEAAAVRTHSTPGPFSGPALA